MQILRVLASRDRLGDTGIFARYRPGLAATAGLKPDVTGGMRPAKMQPHARPFAARPPRLP